MLLRFILGEAGSGKSYRIREEFLQNIEKRPILIVPEQITLLEQKRLVSEQAGRGLLGADVLSFRRLAHRILAEKGEKDLVVLDEINYAIHFGMLSAESVAELLKKRPPAVNLILTGRYAPEILIDLADTVTEMQPIKHAFEKGIRARKGIEF